MLKNKSNVSRIWNDSNVNSPITILGAGADANILLINTTLIEAKQSIRCNIYNTNDDFNMLLQQNGATFAYRVFTFNVDSVSGYNITCVALHETSDKRLKRQIEDVETECSELVKKIKARKYYMNGDKNKQIHNIESIADEIEETIPPDMKNIVTVILTINTRASIMVE